MSIGTPRVTYTPPGTGGATVDLTCYVDSLSIVHGRDDTDSQPDAGAVTLEVSANPNLAPPLPLVDVGGRVNVNVTVAGANIARFVGTVSDISQGWDDAGPNTPDHAIMQVIATEALATLGRRVVGDVPWSQELDGSRVAKILTAAGIGWNPNLSDPGTVQVLARDVDSQPALDLAQAVAADAGGILWQTRDGSIRYADAVHRNGTAPLLELDSCDVLVTPTWQRSTQGLINSVSIGYGPTPSEGEQPRYVADRPTSIAEWGTWGLSATTELAAAADAQALAGMILARNSEPVWLMSALPVDVKGLSDADTQALLNLEVNDLILLTQLPNAGDAPSTAYLWVEGWTEQLEAGRHDLTLSVSGYCRTSPPPTWDRLDSTLTWDAMGATTWDEATCLGPPIPEGRWSDIASSWRWNTVDPAATWDTADRYVWPAR